MCICILLFVWILLGLIWGCIPPENIYFSISSQSCFQPGTIFNFPAFDLLDHASGTNLNPKSHGFSRKTFLLPRTQVETNNFPCFLPLLAGRFFLIYHFIEGVSPWGPCFLPGSLFQFSNLFSLTFFLLSSNDYVNSKLLGTVKANAPWTAVASPQA